VKVEQGKQNFVRGMFMRTKFIQGTQVFQSLIVLIRFLFGLGWFLAGVTKITEKRWFSEPSVFLHNYLINALENNNVPLFYKNLIENLALQFVTPLNYIIPIVQISLGLFIIVGFLTIPSILACLFMHINFILSGNMNVISLVLYTSAFTLIIFRNHIYYFSLDKFFHLEQLFNLKAAKIKKNTSVQYKRERLFH
jgi:thiosulfate dehydrogenase [quinone] large subunit